jgi:hypothetical protein
MKIRIAVICTLFSVSAATVTTSVIAEPLVTISCDQPMGSSIAYGAPSSDRTNARSEPTSPTLAGPIKDGFTGKPTFVIDSNRKKITIIWSELEEDIKLREQAKKFNLPQLSPLPAYDGVVVQFTPEQIRPLNSTFGR